MNEIANIETKFYFRRANTDVPFVVGLAHPVQNSKAVFIYISKRIG